MLFFLCISASILYVGNVTPHSLASTTKGGLPKGTGHIQQGIGYLGSILIQSRVEVLGVYGLRVDLVDSHWR